MKSIYFPQSSYRLAACADAPSGSSAVHPSGEQVAVETMFGSKNRALTEDLEQVSKSL